LIIQFNTGDAFLTPPDPNAPACGAFFFSIWFSRLNLEGVPGTGAEKGEDGLGLCFEKGVEREALGVEEKMFSGRVLLRLAVVWMLLLRMLWIGAAAGGCCSVRRQAIRGAIVQQAKK
jgi:hypothetical protein